MRENSVPQPSVHTRVVPGVVDVIVLKAASTGTEVHGGTPTTRDAGSLQNDYWQVLTLQRGAQTRCPGSWEIVHGRIEPDERPEHAATREVLEETGYQATRLYNITVNAFYLHQTATVQLALVFAAVVDGNQPVVLGAEHVASEWRSFADAATILAWPREREALLHVQQLLGNGNAGAVEDVLRVF